MGEKRVPTETEMRIILKKHSGVIDVNLLLDLMKKNNFLIDSISEAKEKYEKFEKLYTDEKDYYELDLEEAFGAAKEYIDILKINNKIIE